MRTQWKSEWAPNLEDYPFACYLYMLMYACFMKSKWHDPLILIWLSKNKSPYESDSPSYS